MTATEKNVSQKIKKIEALGGVIVNSKEQKATGNRADFMMQENIVILTGNVVVSQGQNVMRGDKLIVELNTNKAHMEAGTKDKPGRVQGLFLPSDKDEKKKDGDKDKKSESGKHKHKSKAQSDSDFPDPLTNSAFRPIAARLNHAAIPALPPAAGKPIWRLETNLGLETAT